MRGAVEKLSRSQALVLLRYTLIIAMAYLVLVEHGFSSTPRGLLLLIVAALASNVLVARLPVRITESTAFYAGVILGDTLWITAALIYSGLFGAEFFYLYFFVLLLAGIGENVGLIAVGATVVCIAYVFVLSATGGSASLWSSRLLIRIPFLITAAAFYGYIVDRVRRERQRAREEAETVAHLEEVQHELSGHAQQLERANETLAQEISERERAEQALKAAKDYAESLIGSSLDMIVSTDVNRNIVEFNQAAEDAFGYSKVEVIDKPISILYADLSEGLRVQADLRNNDRFAGEVRNKRKNGEGFYAFLSASVIRDANGTIVGGVGVSRDITESKQAEAALRRYEHIVAGTNDFMAFIDKDYTYQAINESYLQAFGKRREEIIGHTGEMLFGTEVFDTVLKPYQDRCLAGEEVFYETFLDFPLRGRRFMDVHYNPFREPDGSISGIVVSVRDITERRRAEETMRLIVEGTATVVGKDFFHSLVRHVANAFQVRFAFISELVDEEGKRLRTIALWSGEGFGENFEYDTKGTPCEKVVTGKDLSFYSQGVQKLFPGDRWLKEAGVESYLGIPFFSASGNVIGHMGVMHDKPLGEELKSMLAIFASRAGVELERKRAEEALLESEERYRTLFENAPIGFGVADADGTFLAFNNAMLEPGGYTREDIAKVGNVAHLYDNPDERAIVLATAQRHGFLHQHEVRFKRKDGSCYDALLSLTPIRMEGRLGWQAMVQDITERKQAEEELQNTQLQLIQSAKLESVGRLAAGVAHEVKNPLAIILQGLAYLSHNASTSDNDNVSMVLEKMDNAVKRADRVIGGLLDFTAQRAGDVRPAEVNAVLEQSLLLVHHELVKARVTVVKELGENLPLLKLDRHKIEQVFVNLFINAIQAMPGGGTLTVKTKAKQPTELGPDDGGRQTDPVDGEESLVVVEVEDTGTGIPKDKLDRIFDPFFTMKPTGQGTGLGLTVTRKIVELHGGKIDIRNRQKGGVRVTLTFKTDEGLGDTEKAVSAKTTGGVPNA